MSGVIIALGAIGLYGFVLVMIKATLPDDPSAEQIISMCFWPVYPIVRIAFALYRLAERLGTAIRARRAIPRAHVRSEGDGTR